MLDQRISLTTFNTGLRTLIPILDRGKNSVAPPVAGKEAGVVRRAPAFAHKSANGRQHRFVGKPNRVKVLSQR